jgi:DNA-directed RNA polymerase specialized sigma24 family protein
MRDQTQHPATEQALNRSIEEQQGELYWLAYLLTGDREISANALIEALNVEESVEDSPNSFFREWMSTWARKLVIANALRAIHGPLKASARQRDWQRVEYSALQDKIAAGNPFTAGFTRAELERALLAIDMFPRCALLLTVFEQLSLEDAAILLDASKAQVRSAKTVGLVELTRRLTAPVARKSPDAPPAILLLEGQPA